VLFDPDYLLEPPSQAYEEKSPIFEEFGRLAFEIVADELQYPTDHEKARNGDPDALDKETDRYQQN
jgi:hypothetical protein